MCVIVSLLLVAAVGVFVYMQVQKAKAASVQTPPGVKDAPHDKA